MNKIILGLALVIMIGCCAFTVIYVKKGAPKIAYVELESVYNDFELKKELEVKITTVQNLRKNILDSLKLQLSALSNRYSVKKDEQTAREFEARKQEYYQKEKEFTENNTRTSKSYTDQIWKQLNQYAKDYGKEQGYTYILGYDGQGALLYGQDAVNVTDAMKKYVNIRYKGGVSK
jgi:outer membrane protein